MNIGIQRYIVAYIAVGFALLLTTGVIMQHRTERVSMSFHQRSVAAAEQELTEGINSVIDTLTMLSQRIIERGDSALALDVMSYEQWRDGLVAKLRPLYPYIIGMEAYSNDGTALSVTYRLSPVTSFPEQLNDPRVKAVPALLVGHEDNDVTSIYRIAPVSGTEGIGYIGVKADLGKALAAVARPRYLDLHSLDLSFTHAGYVSDPKDVQEHIRFRVLPTTEMGEMRVAVNQLVVQYTILGIAYMVLVWMFSVERVGKPLTLIAERIRALRHGDRGAGGELPHLTGWLKVREIDDVITAVNDYQKMRHEQHQVLEVYAYTDALTGAQNRHALAMRWQALKGDPVMAEKAVSMILLDCDNFKAINDTYGHLVGDQVLRGIVEACKTALRDSDLLYRIGGDEFAAVLPGVGRTGAELIATRCLEALEKHPFAASGVREPVKVSVGIAAHDRIATATMEGLKGQADIAMYQAKRPSVRKIAVYDESMQPLSASLLSNRIAHLIGSAIESGANLEIHYQPITPVHSGPLLYEALLRLREPDSGGLLMPSQIFPFVEERGFEVEMDLAVLRAVVQDLRMGQLPPGVGVSVNFAPMSIVSDRILAPLQELRAVAGPAVTIVLEVIESGLFGNMAGAHERIQELRTMGFKIALDDFGSGYSSLRHLIGLPVDIVKLAADFVRDMEHDARNGLILRAIARMLQQAGYEIVAEGIETRHSLEEVKRTGFAYVQGYFIGRPARDIVVPVLEPVVNAL